jgi:hypothetical protein
MPRARPWELPTVGVLVTRMVTSSARLWALQPVTLLVQTWGWQRELPLGQPRGLLKGLLLANAWGLPKAWQSGLRLVPWALRLAVRWGLLSASPRGLQSALQLASRWAPPRATRKEQMLELLMVPLLAMQSEQPPGMPLAPRLGAVCKFGMLLGTLREGRQARGRQCCSNRHTGLRAPGTETGGRRRRCIAIQPTTQIARQRRQGTRSLLRGR